MWKNAYLNIKNPKPQLQIACFVHVTPLCYISNFWPQKLLPPLGKILYPHLVIQELSSTLTQTKTSNLGRFFWS